MTKRKQYANVKNIMNNNTETTTETVLTISQNQQLVRDLVAAVLIVSVVINLTVLIAWIMLQVTTHYDAAFASLLFAR